MAEPVAKTARKSKEEKSMTLQAVDGMTGAVSKMRVIVRAGERTKGKKESARALWRGRSNALGE